MGHISKFKYRFQIFIIFLSQVCIFQGAASQLSPESRVMEYLKTTWEQTSVFLLNASKYYDVIDGVDLKE